MASKKGAVPPPPPDACHFYVEKKRRYCRFPRLPDQDYCGMHTPSSRVPCPFDPSHSVFLSELEHHKQVCNARPSPHPSYYVHNINAFAPGSAPSGPETETRQLKKPRVEVDESGVECHSELQTVPQETLIALATKALAALAQYHESHGLLPHHHLEHPGCIAIREAVQQDAHSASKLATNTKHLSQQSSIAAHMAQWGLLDPHYCYVELGAGKGGLSHTVHALLRQGTFVLIEREKGLRMKADRHHRFLAGTFSRLKVDLAHLHLGRVPALHAPGCPCPCVPEPPAALETPMPPAHQPAAPAPPAETPSSSVPAPASSTSAVTAPVAVGRGCECQCWRHAPPAPSPAEPADGRRRDRRRPPAERPEKPTETPEGKPTETPEGKPTETPQEGKAEGPEEGKAAESTETERQGAEGADPDEDGPKGPPHCTCGGVVGIGKHLCGGATDMALRALVQTLPAAPTQSCCRSGSLAGVAIATCCHHLCTWASLANAAFFTERGFSREEVELLIKMTSWAVSGLRTTDPFMETTLPPALILSAPVAAALPARPDPAAPWRLSREMVGRACKRLVDWSRVEYLRAQGGLQAGLVEYVPAAISPENCLLWASRTPCPRTPQA
ncbi:putative tRNA guanosine-2'-O-methyltransferase [Paratrimastix pyriformis]|uniref:tRNA:m(4)X modification enzyme TRM13 n=1 Tax=Paratrimastix pyriformis TaxID=342808 RepID=A0ABQ8UL32_9EUKA|nr:putative tRNA guanosine-2'-O-methyltransferase [Paratrimastix pyriformis]